MLIERMRILPCIRRRLFDENNPNIPRFSYFNPSSAFPYIYVRATENVEKSVCADVNHMFIFSYDTDKMSMISMPQGLLRPTYNFHQGIEDTRLVMYNDRLWFVATSTHVSKSMQSEMIIGYFDADAKKIEHAEHLDFGVRPIKNICPFVYNKRLFVIDMYVFTIYSIDEHTNNDGTVSYVAKEFKKLKPCSGIKEHTLRGSTNPVHLHGNIWGCVVHSHIPRLPKGALAYISYWLEFDIERGAITFSSDPFVISCLGIEFVSGIEYYHDKGMVELYFGVKDRDPVVATTTLYDLRIGCTVL